ncbi:MAG: class I adenylate-forming enzyme family protein [Pseudomonadota bacterium]
MLLHEMYLTALERTPDKAALIIDDVVVTYRQLDLAVDRFARALHGLGLHPGDRVSLFMGNRPELAALYLACSRLGVVAVPSKYYYKTEELAYVTNLCGSRILLVGAEKLPAAMGIRRIAPCLEGVYAVGGDPTGDTQPWTDALFSAPHTVAWPRVDGSHPAMVAFTSGTTSRPKGVTLTQESLFHAMESRRITLGHTADDGFLTSSWLCHGAAVSIVLLPMIACGGTALLMSQFSPERYLTLLRTRRPTFAAAAPMQVQRLLNCPDGIREDFSSLKAMFSGGDATPLALQQDFFRKTGRELHIGLGLTECGAAIIGPIDRPFKPGTIGLPMHGVDARLIDDRGRPVTQGEVGEIILRTPSVMAGYWNDPEATAGAIVDGWLHTGDLGRQDADGYFIFIGRKKNIIVRDTSNISPAQVENDLNTHPKVKACGVTGIPDAAHGQAVAAFIVPADPADRPAEDELTVFARAKMNDLAVPGLWFFIDALPLTDMGKIDRQALARMALALREDD